MKTVVLNGSPRKDGNTAKLLKKATEEHGERRPEIFGSCDMKIKPCMGCMYCKSHELCSINDDMNKIYKAIKEADAVILGSPIYMGAETAWLKGALDNYTRRWRKILPDLGSPLSSTLQKRRSLYLPVGNPRGQDYIPT